MYLFIAALLTCILSVAVDGVFAEKHTITFDNQCGFGSPRLIQKGNVLSTGEPFTSNGPFSSAIAYLQTGNCLLNGEGCTSVEMTLVNPTCPGCGSSTDISLIPPLKFSVPTTFSYQGGCQGQGATCATEDCKTAFFVPDDNQVQVQCQENDVNLLITFCGGSGSKPVTTLNVQPKPAPSSTHVQSASAVPASSSSTVPPVKLLPISHSSSTLSSSIPTPTPSISSNAPACARNGSRRRRRRSLASSSNSSNSEVDAHSHRVVHSRRRGHF